MALDLITDLDVYRNAVEKFNSKIAELRQHDENKGRYLMVESIGRDEMKFNIGTRQDYENREKKESEILMGGKI